MKKIICYLHLVIFFLASVSIPSWSAPKVKRKPSTESVAIDYGPTISRRFGYLKIERAPDLPASQLSAGTMPTKELRPESLKEFLEDAAASVEIKFEDLRAKQILSLGEGKEGFVEFLNDKGIAAIGIDIDEEYQTASYPACKRYPGAFIFGDALKLSQNKDLQNKRFDLILSHFLYCPCCIGVDGMKTSLAESEPFLKAGGESRHYFTTRYKDSNESENYIKALPDYLTEARRRGVNYKVRVFQNEVKTGLLIILKKL